MNKDIMQIRNATYEAFANFVSLFIQALLHCCDYYMIELIENNCPIAYNRAI